MNGSELQLLGAAVIGMALQWWRAHKSLPNWLGYASLGLVACAVYYWITPSVVTQFHADWRGALAAAIVWWLSVRGSAATSKDLKAAPPAA